MQRSAVRSRMQHLVAILCGAVASVAAPAAAQTVNHQCQAVNPPTTVCAGQGQNEICLLKYRTCSLDYDGVSGFERQALLFEDRGEYAGLFGVGDTRCYQGENFAPNANAPDPAEYGYNRFVLIFPKDYAGSGELPLYIHFRAHAPGWVDQELIPFTNGWAQDFSEDKDNPTWEKGLYRGNLEFAQAVPSEQSMFARAFSNNELNGRLHTKTDPSYAFLIPSGCSNDGNNGREHLGVDDDDFVEAEHDRFSYTAVFHALEFIRNKYGIDHIYTGALSAGGIGSFILGRDLADSEEFYGQPGIYRGALMISAPFETDAMEALIDPADTRRVDADDNCEEPSTNEEAVVPSVNISEPLVNAFDEVGLSHQSASADILSAKINVPILHVWSARDGLHAYDKCYSEANIHGPIRDAIEARKDGPPYAPFEYSENFNPCIGSCRAMNGVVIDCVEHGLTGREPVGDCALDWIDAINAYWEDDVTYATPASCQANVHQTDTTPPDCDVVGEEDDI